MVKNLPAMLETWVPSLSWEDPLEKGIATLSGILVWRIPMDRGTWQATVHGVPKSRTRVTNIQKQSFVHIIFSMPRKPGPQQTAVDDHSLSCQPCVQAWLTHSAGLREGTQAQL